MTIRKIINKLIEMACARKRLCNYYEFEDYWKWSYEGKPVPPPEVVKRMTIKEYAHKYNIDIMVETGTYKGDMIFAMKDIFNKIYSIELNKMLYINAKKRFEEYSQVRIYNGDSSEIIPEIVENINEPCLFWLDGHYMPSIGTKGEKETPIIKEIEHISNHSVKNHILLIDDARFFIGENDYPTIIEFRDIAHAKFPKHSFVVENDIIRIAPHLY